MARGQDTGSHESRRVDRDAHLLRNYLAHNEIDLLGRPGNSTVNDLRSASMMGEIDLMSDRRGNPSPQKAVASGDVAPTSKAAMEGMHGPQCNNCGSYNTEKSSGATSCYDCGHDHY